MLQQVSRKMRKKSKADTRSQNAETMAAISPDLIVADFAELAATLA